MVKKVDPDFIFCLENCGASKSLIRSLKMEWSSMEIFEMVRKGELTPEEGARILVPDYPWYKKILNILFLR